MTDVHPAPAWENDTSLLPAIVQHATTLQVLMLGYMNREAWEVTLRDGLVTFFSRSRSRLWTKGETSGNTLRLVSAAVDCDRDTILLSALPAGPTCHRGSCSCFGSANAPGLGFLARLAQVIADRAGSHDSASYTASLLAQGTSRVAQKVGEEAVETLLAAMEGDREALAEESADLLYHLLVLLHDQGLGLPAVIEVLRERHRPTD